MTSQEDTSTGDDARDQDDGMVEYLEGEFTLPYPSYDFVELAKGCRVVAIRHEGVVYYLKLTKKFRLVLHK